MKKKNDITNIDHIIELMTDLVFFKNKKGQYIKFNQAFLDFIKKNRDEVLNKTDYELLSKKNADAFTSIDNSIFEKNEGKILEEVFVLDNNEKAYFKTNKQILYDEDGEQVGLYCIAKNITKRKQYEIIYQDSQLLLEYIAKEDNLRKVLDKIVLLSESRNFNSKCSILLLSEDKEHLIHGSAPNLPSFYNEAINGIEIGKNAGSCGASAFNSKTTIVENIDEHENWLPYLELTKRANLHACWSEPILSSRNKVLGTFAIYYEKATKPTSFELKIISAYAHLASVAIEKDLNYKLLQEKEILLSNQSKIASMEELLSNIAHQWRQPLSIISTAASGVRMHKELDILEDEIFDSSIDSILDSTKFLSMTLDTFRGYFKTNDKKEEFYIKDSLEKAKNTLVLSFTEKNVFVIEDIMDVKLNQIENVMIQVFINILKNSYDAFSSNIDSFIFINITEIDDEIIITIKDTAGGISNDIIDRIFEPYFTTKHKSLGTGIGLYMCKEIIEKQMNGLLLIKNETFSYNNKNYNGAKVTIKLNK